MIKILRTSQATANELFERVTQTVDVSETVREIIANVRENGDSALLEYAKKFEKVDLEKLEVTNREFDEAMAAVRPEFLEILKEAAENIREFHKNQLRSGFVLSNKPGVVMGQKVMPLEKVGLYVPGGTAAYPSTVLMNAVPAKLAGCREIVMVTPCRADGTIMPEILAAAKIGGVTRVFKTGGAQAVAALAYGTESVPRVDKIVGPGNQYVAEADAAALAEKVKEAFPDCDVDYHSGGQPVYYYLVSLE